MVVEDGEEDIVLLDSSIAHICDRTDASDKSSRWRSSEIRENHMVCRSEVLGQKDKGVRKGEQQIAS